MSNQYIKQAQTIVAVKEDIAALKDEWVDCRDMRHAWQVHTDFYVDDDSRIHRDLECMRCGTVRKESYENNKWGLNKTSNAYVYPENYQLTGVQLRGIQGGPLNQLIRHDQYRRAMDKIAAANQRH